MSRIGKKHILMPSDVTITVDNNLVTVKGAKGTLHQSIDKEISVNVENNQISLTRSNDSSDLKAKHGLYRMLIANMVKGVSEGFEKNLVIKGVGYKASKVGNKLVLNVGYSNLIEVLEEDGITIECPSTLEIKIKGIDKQKVGQFASKIRDIRKVEPYHGYGIRYDDEVVIKKVGKTAAKGKK